MAVILNVVVECVCGRCSRCYCCYPLVVVVVVDTQTMRCRTARGSTGTPHAFRVYCLAINSLDNNFSLAS